MQVQVRIGRSILSASRIPLDTVLSAHTRRPLARAELEFMVTTDTLQAEVLQALQGAKDRTPLVVVEGEKDTRFIVEHNSYSSRGSGPPWIHGVTVREFESLKPEALVIDGLELRPYSYDERDEGEGISIVFKVRLDGAGSADLLGRIRAASQHPASQRPYFDVVRRGLEGEPRTMRFGKCRWSKADDEFIYEIALVEKMVDDSRPPLDFFHPELSNLMTSSAHHGAMIDALLDQLTVRGVITEEQAVSVKQRAEAEEWRRRWDLRRMDDVDEG